MTRPSARICLFLILIPLSFPSLVAARSFRVEEIPNGAANGCLTCHTGNGGPLNAFGQEIENDFLDAPGEDGHVIWGFLLAARDSDGDLLSNGEELFDPDGLWLAGDEDPVDVTAVLTNPGLGDSDSDGIGDFADLCPDISDPDQTDTDEDGAGDACDDDDDGDGLPDEVETDTGIFVDSNDTGTSPIKADTDGEGLSDSVETNSGVFVNQNDTGTSPVSVDTDGDNWDDESEVFFGSDPNDQASNPGSGTGKLLALGGADGDSFGLSVALSSAGDDALVGADGTDTDGGNFSGVAFLFGRDPEGRWSSRAELMAPDGQPDDAFGSAVALSGSGDRALIGSVLDDTFLGVDSGSAWVFARAGDGTWSDEGRLLNPGGAQGDGFGVSVALSSSEGDTALVGADGASGAGGVGSGSVTVFTRAADGSWSLQQSLEASDSAEGDAFGVSVALSSSGDTAIVGADFDTTPLGQNSGSAWIFQRAAEGSWSPQAQLLAPDGLADDAFGYSVALSSSGDMALVGAHGDDIVAGPAAGSAHVFTRSAEGIWSHEAQLLAPDGAEGDRFGFSVALGSSGDTALVGADLDDSARGVDGGTAYFFARSQAGEWTYSRQLVPADGALGDNFGVSVSLSEARGTALVGSVMSDTAADLNTGAAYLFQTDVVVGDTDDDGFDDDVDNCPDVANAGQENHDGDLEGDACDDDDDNDGTPDGEDAFPMDSSEDADTDQDGTGNNADLDDDGDGFPDAIEEALGSDPLDAASAPSVSDIATFDAFGGYTAYIANPENSDLFNVEAGVCDETAAFEHWRDTGFAGGRGFAEGKLRTDHADGSPDSDYEIDGGFSWEYPAANTVVFITADAQKPAGWAGRDLLLERCQTFNIGSHYTAEAYRTINTDVADAIDGGQIPGFSSVTDHYVKYGFKEGRLTNSDWSQAELDAWDDSLYFAQNQDVETFFNGAQSEGWIAFGKIGFAHWINFGRYEGRSDGQ